MARESNGVRYSKKIVLLCLIVMTALLASRRTARQRECGRDGCILGDGGVFQRVDTGDGDKTE